MNFAKKTFPTPCTAGSPCYTDPDSGANGQGSLTIIDGNAEGFFKMNPTSGALTVDNSGLNYELGTREFTLTIQARYEGPGSVADTADIKIRVIDVNEQPPLASHTYAVPEHSPKGYELRTTPLRNLVSDPDYAQTWIYTITAQNPSVSAWTMATNPEYIAVDDSNQLDYETCGSPCFALTMTTTDQGAPGPPQKTSAPATIAINLLDVNEPPTVTTPAGPFQVDENMPTNTFVGLLSGTDPDDRGKQGFADCDQVASACQKGPDAGGLVLRWDEAQKMAEAE